MNEMMNPLATRGEGVSSGKAGRSALASPGTVGVLLAAGLVLVLGGLAGCPPQEEQGASPATQPGATTRSGSASRPVAAIPSQALLHLDALQPPVAKPTTRPADIPVSDRAKDLVAEASRLLAKRDYSGAMAPLERAIGYDPRNSTVLRLLGLMYYGLGDRGRAQDYLQKAVVGAPDDLEAQVLLGDLAITDRKTTDAILRLRKALQCTGADANEPLAAEALLKLGGLLEERNYWTAALECYAKLAQWLDASGTRYAERPLLKQFLVRPEHLMSRQGTVLMLLRRPGEAREFLQGAYRRDRTDPAVATLLVHCLLDLKDFPGAESVLLNMASEPLLQRQVPMLVEDAARAAGNPGLPARIWRALPKKMQADSLLAIALAQACQRLGNNDAAIEILQSVFQAMPESIAMARELAELAAKVGRPEQALAILVKTLCAGEAAEPAVLQGLRRLVRTMPAGLEEQLAKKPPADPNEAFAYHYAVGRLAQMRYNEPLAAAEFQKSVDARKDFRPAREALLDTLLDRSLFSQAREQLAGLAKLVEPWFADYLLGKIELAQGEIDKGLAALEKSVAANDRYVPALLLLAEAHRRKGDLPAAVRRLDEAFKIASDKMEVYRRRFPLLLEAGQFRQAEAEVESLRREDPENLDLAVMMAELLLRQPSQKDRAAKFVADLAQKHPDSPEVMVLSVRADLGPVSGILSRGDLEKARKRLDETFQRDPRSVPARKALAEMHLLAARYAEAAREANQLNHDRPRDQEIARLAVRAALLARDYPQAQQLLEGMLSFAPGDTAAQEILLTVLERQKKFDRAVRLAEQWLAQADQDDLKASYRRRLVGLYEDANQYDKSLKLAEELAKTGDPLTRQAFQMGRIRTLVRAGKVEEAVKLAGELAGPQGDANRPRLVLVYALERAKKLDRALQLLDQWIGKRTDAHARPLLIATLSLCMEANRLEKVHTLAADWIKASPGEVLPREFLIGSLDKAGGFDEALSTLEKWLAAAAAGAQTSPASMPATSRSAGPDPNLADWCRLEIARVLIHQEKYAEAIKRLDQFPGEPNQLEKLNLRSNCLRETGKMKEAIECEEQACKLRPFDPEALNNLGYFLADAGVDLPRAEGMIRNALAAKVVNRLHIEDSLGWVLYKRGSFREAAAVFDGSIRREEDNLAGNEEGRPISCVIYDHAGDAFWRLGWGDRAVEYWKAALDSAAKEGRPRSSEDRAVLNKTPQKIKAVQEGKTPPVAPLGEGVKE